MLIKQTQIDPDVLSTIIEQRVAAGSTYDGIAPADAVEDFVPFYDDDLGIWRLGKPDESTFEGTHGGLFVMAHKQPMVLEQVLADLGTSLAYTLSIVTTSGTIPIATGTSRYIAYSDNSLRWRFQKGEKIKLVVAAGTAAMWARIYTRAEQAVSV
jgi:hypothetical protein